MLQAHDLKKMCWHCDVKKKICDERIIEKMQLASYVKASLEHTR